MMAGGWGKAGAGQPGICAPAAAREQPDFAAALERAECQLLGQPGQKPPARHGRPGAAPSSPSWSAATRPWTHQTC